MKSISTFLDLATRFDLCFKRFLHNSEVQGFGQIIDAILLSMGSLPLASKAGVRAVGLTWQRFPSSFYFQKLHCIFRFVIEGRRSA
jgi:hypothetical protein